jgi:hypothetical protein
MRTLKILLTRLFLRKSRRPAHRETVEVKQAPSTFESWISEYRQRLRQHCEKDERSNPVSPQ